MGTSLSSEVEKFVEETNRLIGDVKVEHVLNDVDVYLNYTSEDLYGMTKQSCVHAQYFLMQYSISLGRKINTFKYKLAANKRTFDRALSQVYNSYNTYGGFEIVKGMACSEHENLRFMDNEICKLESIITEYDGVSQKIEKMAQIFRDLSFSK